MNKTNIFWTITLTRGKYHQLPQIDGKWFDYLNFTSIISQRIVLLSPILQESFPRFLACWCNGVVKERHLNISQPISSPQLCYALTMILVLEYFKMLLCNIPRGLGIETKENLQNSIDWNLILQSVKTYLVFVTNWLLFMASVLLAVKPSLCGGSPDNILVSCILIFDV